MALNKEVFKTRSLTAVVFVLVMLAGLFWNVWSFVVLFTIIHFGCWFEFVKLMKKIHGGRFLPYCAAGIFYISMPVLMLVDIRLDGFTLLWHIAGLVHVCTIIFGIWINDTMAYIVGSLIGKTPFSKISPKKTWEGTAGGALLCVIVMALIGKFVLNDFVRPAVVAALCAVFGTAGDLLESKIKRMADVKDSGSFMPGHGGFLDRFDSLLVATPFVWLYLQLIG